MSSSPLGLPERGEATSPRELATQRAHADSRALPSHDDPLVREGSAFIGGPAGLHAVIGRQKYLTPLRVILFIALIFLSLGWFSKAACLQQSPDPTTGVLRLDQPNNRAFTAMCYSDTVPLYSAEGLDKDLRGPDGKPQLPYQYSWQQTDDGKPVIRRMEYPVVTGFYMYGSMKIAKAWKSAQDRWGIPGAIEPVLFFTVVALGLALCWLVTIWATAMLAGRRIWMAAVAAASPLVAVHIFTNFDAIATAALALAMLAWSRKLPWLTGIALGIGMAAKLYPVLLLLPLLVLCLRNRQARDFFAAAAATIGTWVVINLPVAVAFPAGWQEFFRLNRERGVDPDTIYQIFSGFTGFSWGNTAADQARLLNPISLGLFVLVCAGVVAVGLWAPHPPQVAQLIFLLVAGFLLVNKVWSPQYSLWLVPLAVLAIPNIRLLLAWMVVDAMTWIPRNLWYLGTNNKGIPQEVYLSFVLVRDLMVIALCVIVIRNIMKPDQGVRRMPWSTRAPARELSPAR